MLSILIDTVKQYREFSKGRAQCYLLGEVVNLSTISLFYVTAPNFVSHINAVNLLLLLT